MRLHHSSSTRRALALAATTLILCGSGCSHKKEECAALALAVTHATKFEPAPPRAAQFDEKASSDALARERAIANEASKASEGADKLVAKTAELVNAAKELKAYYAEVAASAKASADANEALLALQKKHAAAVLDRDTLTKTSQQSVKPSDEDVKKGEAALAKMRDCDRALGTMICGDCDEALKRLHNADMDQRRVTDVRGLIELREKLVQSLKLLDTKDARLAKTIADYDVAVKEFRVALGPYIPISDAKTKATADLKKRGPELTKTIRETEEQIKVDAPKADALRASLSAVLGKERATLTGVDTFCAAASGDKRMFKNLD